MLKLTPAMAHLRWHTPNRPKARAQVGEEEPLVSPAPASLYVHTCTLCNYKDATCLLHHANSVDRVRPSAVGKRGGGGDRAERGGGERARTSWQRLMYMYVRVCV